jgi:hypothetical protein
LRGWRRWCRFNGWRGWLDGRSSRRSDRGDGLDRGSDGWRRLGGRSWGLFCCGTLIEDTLCLGLLTLSFCKRTGRTKRGTANRTFQACVEDTVDVLLAKRFSCGSGSLLGQDTKKFLRTFGSTFTESSLQKFFCYAYLERLGNNR